MPGKHSRLFNCWCSIRNRCNNPKHAKYRFYGARGIRVCDEWLYHFAPFRDWALANGYSDSLTIDRIDSNGNYCPQNCRWITMVEQNNNRRSNIKVEFRGEFLTLAQLSRKYAEPNGVPYKQFWSRFRKQGWDLEKCILP